MTGHHYLSDVIKKAGYPLWDKARIFQASSSVSKGMDASNGEVVYIPFVLDSANYINALLKVKLNSSDTAFRMLYASNYRKLVMTVPIIQNGVPGMYLLLLLLLSILYLDIRVLEF